MALGLPIRANETVVTVGNPQKWLLDDAVTPIQEDRMAEAMDEPFDEYDGFDEF